MNIIFLDIDGVLNSDYSERKNGPRVCGYTGIESTLVKKLRTIVDETNSRIVLVSSWKDSYDVYINKVKKNLPSYIIYDIPDKVIGKYLYNKLSKENLHILDTTIKYELNPYTRGYGIKKYIDSYTGEKIDNFVILDDEIFGDYKEYNLMNNLIKTNPSVGLTDENVQEAISKLKNIV